MLLQQLQAAGAALAPVLEEVAKAPIKPNRCLTGALWEREQARTAASPTAQAAAAVRLPLRPAASLQELLLTLNRSLPRATLTPLLGNAATEQLDQATCVHLRLGDTLAAVVLLQQPGGLAPLHAAVLSVKEGALPLASIWAVSRHAAFRRVTEAAAAALRHFETEAEASPCSVLERLLLWLATYSDLFTRSSAASDRLLVLDEGEGALLPPCWRPCRLSWQQLWAAALDPGGRTALHAEHAEGQLLPNM